MKQEMSLQDFHAILGAQAAKQGIPVFGGFELTQRCNLSCKMCYAKQNGTENKELSTKQWIALGQAAADNGALVIFLTGGEPLIRSDFREIYEAYSRMGFRLNLFSNGTLITEEFAKWLSQIPPSTVDISLYGASYETYLNLCGQGEAFKKTINAIELLLKYKINTRIKTTIVHTNMHDYQAIRNTASSYGIEFIDSNLIHGNRSEGISKIESERLTPEEMYQFTRNNMNDYNCDAMDLQLLKDKCKNMPAMYCSAAKSAFFINWEGKLLPCPLFLEPYTKPLETGYKMAWDELREKIKSISLSDQCGGCDKRALCPACPPKLYLETGRFDAVSPYFCRLAEIKESLCIKEA